MDTSPDEGQLTVNPDAFVFPVSEFFSVGMVVRDCNGWFLRGKNLKLAGVLSVIEAEAVGVLKALSWVKDMSSQNIVIESDALLVVNALKNNLIYQLEVGSTLEACQTKLREHSSIKIKHIKKLANRAAHIMARVSCTLNGCNVFRSLPKCLLETILYESLLC